MSAWHFNSINTSMKKTYKLLLVSLVGLVSLSSCSQRLVDFTVISSKNHSIPIDKSQGIRVKGKSMGFLGLGASIKDAMDKALQSAGPDFDLLIDGVVRIEDYFFVSGFVVEGVAVSSSKVKAAAGLKGFDDWYKRQNVFHPDKATLQIGK
jgi:hypothetical protein